MGFFNSLRIGTKILAGYSVALALAGIIGVLAIIQLNQVNATVIRLTGHLSQERDLAEETSVQIHRIRLYADQYISQGQTLVALANYNQALADAQALLDEADRTITEKSRADLQVQTRENFDRFAAAFAEIVQLLANRQEIVTNVLNPQGTSSADKLALLRNNSFESLDFTSANYASQARDTFSQMQVGVNQYMASGNEQYAVQADADFESIISTFDLLSISVRDENSRRLVLEISATITAYNNGYQAARLLVVRQRELVTNQLDVHGRAVDQLASNITNNINDEFAAQSEATGVLVYQTRLVILLTMGLIISLGFLFGLALSNNITKPIEELALAAQSIAAGAFDQKVQVQSHDELGILGDAFNEMTTHMRETMVALTESLGSLRASEERYRGLFEDSPIALWEEDASALKQRIDALRAQGVSDWREYFEGHPDEVRACAALISITDVNRAGYTMHKFETREAMLGPLPGLFVEKTYDGFDEDLITLANGGTHFDKETVHQTTQGEEILIQLRFRILPGYEETWSKILVSLIDITQRKQAEAKLRESQERLNAVITSAMDAIITVDEDQRIVLFNPAAEKMFLCSAEDALGEKIGSFIPDRFHSVHQKHITLFEQAGQTNRDMGKLRSISGLRANGEEFPIDASVSQIDIAGQHLYTVILRDITERKRAEENLAKQLEHLRALSIIDQAIATSSDLSLTLDVFIEKVIQQLRVDAAVVLLFNPYELSLNFAAGQGLLTDALRHTHLKLGVGLAGRAALERILVHETNLPDLEDNIALMPAVINEGFVSYYGVPLVAKDQLLGVLEIFHRANFDPDDDWLSFLKTMAGQAAIAIDNAILFSDLHSSNIKLERAYDTTLEGWSRALDLRDKETEGHTRRVAELTLQLAREFGFDKEELMQIRRGGLLHDIGKMGIPDSVLLKPGPLTEDEWTIMRKHPGFAYEMLSPIEYLQPALVIPYCHHERWDGSGYPRGLRGEEIPFSARIFAVVDVWDALTSDRPYRAAWTKKKTAKYIRSLSGIKFDAQVVEKFFQIIEK